jgi:Flp pilus assembly CpaF family ATPase
MAGAQVPGSQRAVRIPGSVAHRQLSEEQVAHDVTQATRILLDREKALLNIEERERLVREIQDEVFGPPLEPLLQDPSVNDVLVNGCGDIRWSAPDGSRRRSRASRTMPT